MAYTLNRVDLVGNLGQDPEIRTFPSGGKIASLSIATSEKWTDKRSGEAKEKTEWHRVTIKNDFLADIAAGLRKGQTVVVSGKLETRKWQDQSGADRFTTEIVVSGYSGLLILPNVRLTERRGGGGAVNESKVEGRSDPALDDEIPF